MSRSMSVAGMAGMLLLVSVSVGQAQEVEVSGNVSITSDYVYRGISQTLEEPAVQGGLDLATAFGGYLGLWGSSVNFGEDLGVGPRAQMELDAYGGFAPSVAGFDLDVGGIYYAYPGAADVRSYDFFEVYGSVGRAVGPVSLGVSGAYSPDFFAASGAGVFGSLEASLGIPDTPVSLDASLAKQTIEDNDVFGTPDYSIWSVGASAEAAGFGFGASVIGTDLDEGDCFGGSDLCATRFVVSIGRAL